MALKGTDNGWRRSLRSWEGDTLMALMIRAVLPNATSCAMTQDYCLCTGVGEPGPRGEFGDWTGVCGSHAASAGPLRAAEGPQERVLVL